MESDMAYINDLIRQVREHAGLTLEAVGQAADLSITSVHHYEQGHREVPLRYARSLHQLLNAGRPTDLRLLNYFDPNAAAALLASFNGQAPTRAERRDPRRTEADVKTLGPQAFDAAERALKAARYLHRIIADGKVDDSDHQDAMQMQRDVESAVSLMQQYVRAVSDHLDTVRRPHR